MGEGGGEEGRRGGGEEGRRRGGEGGRKGRGSVISLCLFLFVDLNQTEGEYSRDICVKSN